MARRGGWVEHGHVVLGQVTHPRIRPPSVEERLRVSMCVYAHVGRMGASFMSDSEW